MKNHDVWNIGKKRFSEFKKAVNFILSLVFSYFFKINPVF